MARIRSYWRPGHLQRAAVICPRAALENGARAARDRLSGSWMLPRGEPRHPVASLGRSASRLTYGDTSLHACLPACAPLSACLFCKQLVSLLRPVLRLSGRACRCVANPAGMMRVRRREPRKKLLVRQPTLGRSWRRTGITRSSACLGEEENTQYMVREGTAGVAASRCMCFSCFFS